MRVPIGVAILGFFALLAGLADVLLGLNLIGWVTFGPARTGSGVALTGILALVTGAIYIAVAAAAWSMRPWAWAFGMIMAGVGLFEAFLVMLGTESVATGLGAAILPGIVLF